MTFGAVVYGLVSCWMYVIGMGAAIFTGESDIAQIMVKAGLGIAGLLIIVFSTVTTTFLDAYSAGISSESLGEKIHGKWVAVVVTVIGIAGAILFPMDGYHGLPVFHRICFCADDCHSDCGFLYPEKGREQKSLRVEDAGSVASGLCHLPVADECGHGRRQYSAGYGGYHCALRSCREAGGREEVGVT